MKCSFFLVFFINSILTLVNCYLTPNPYSAFYSGGVGHGAIEQSTSFFVSPAYLLLISMLITVALSKKFRICKIGLIIISSVTVASVVNFSIVNNYITVVYNIISMILLNSIVLNDRAQMVDNREIVEKEFNSFFRYLLALTLLGFILALMFPDIYGIFKFSFSRDDRSQIALWNILKLDILSCIAIIYRLMKRNTNAYWVILLSIITVILSTMNREVIMEVIIALAILAYVKMRLMNKSIAKLIVVMMIIIIGIALSEYFLLGDGFDIIAILNGRDTLWSFYIDNFYENFLFGAGLNLSSGWAYSIIGGAKSEIGLLKWFGECGLFVGCLFTFVSLKALVQSIKLIFYKTYYNIEVFFSLICISITISTLFLGHSRILSFGDFLYWYAAFYMLNPESFTVMIRR